MKNLKPVNIEPNWQSMFDLATSLVKTSLPKDQGCEVVLEMLNYGKRLDFAKGKPFQPTK